MTLNLKPFNAVTKEELQKLNEALKHFYSHTPPSYYETADQSKGRYNDLDLPFHCDLIDNIKPSFTVLDFGCGTSHICPEILRKKAHYTGMDWDNDLLKKNKQLYPETDFCSLENVPDILADVSISLYTLEHVVDPIAYLESLWQHTKSQGLIGIICPEFMNNPSLPPSLYYGKTPRRLREKLQRLALWDALTHLWEVKIAASRWQRRARLNLESKFWLNLSPKILAGAEYTIDSDAIHIVRYDDIENFFLSRGATIVSSSKTLEIKRPEIKRDNMYLLVRKP